MNLIVNKINNALIKEEKSKINLDHNDILKYSTHNEGKSVITEGFITLKAKTYKNDS